MNGFTSWFALNSYSFFVYNKSKEKKRKSKAKNPLKLVNWLGIKRFLFLHTHFCTKGSNFSLVCSLFQSSEEFSLNVKHRIRCVHAKKYYQENPARLLDFFSNIKRINIHCEKIYLFFFTFSSLHLASCGELKFVGSPIWENAKSLIES